ncbi:helicase-related protein, partial [Limnohabitans sp. Rim8]|uniref:helicase-related protein n=1 Tax=Limnohabitans sp. Rim8 TaxID=1100718 RepID=UPI0025E2191D
NLLKNPQSIQVTPSNTTVQRITQVIHPVGRSKKKDVLLHIIQKHDWSQVLVFTRTKFGANNVADFLTKNGVKAMALHGNKSQTARTQALAGFKSGEIRALVATDIAARGIDIEDLPHVVNFEIPNVSEDYVHRIGRTGRAGASGEAVSLVCLDEEGFMMDIERFTKQEIPVQLLEGFGPEPGEVAEPSAMGRQTLWGGAGKPPSRDVMAAAAKAARQDMMQRIRDNKVAVGGGGGGGQRQPRAEGQGQPRPSRNAPPPSRRNGPQGAPRFEGQGDGRRDGGRDGGRDGNREGGRGQGQRGDPRFDNRADGQGRPAPRGPRPEGRGPARGGQGGQGGGQDRRRDDGDELPRHIDPLKTTQFARLDLPNRKPVRTSGQPDPTRTSIDSLASSGRRHGGGGFGGGNRGGNGGGGGGGRGGFGR